MRSLHCTDGYSGRRIFGIISARSRGMFQLMIRMNFDAHMFDYLNDYEAANLKVILNYEAALAGN